MVGHCLKFAPPLCSLLGPEQTRVAVRRALEQAEAHGFTNQGHGALHGGGGRVGALARVQRDAEMLEKLLANPKEDVNVRGNAYISIGHLGDPASEALLKRTAESPDVFLSACAR